MPPPPPPLSLEIYHKPARDLLLPIMALDLDYNYFVFPSYQPSMDWDPHCNTTGAGDDLQEQFMPLAMESPASSQASTGYLQDAVAEWSDRCKRRRVANSSPVHDDSTKTAAAGGLQDLLQEFWDWNCHGDPLRGLNYLLQEEFIIPDDPFAINNLLTTTTQAATLHLPDHHRPLSASSSPDEEELIGATNTDLHKSTDAKPSATPAAPKVMKTLGTFRECDSRKFRKNKARTAMATVTVVYPFAVVKPGGSEGDVTLDDINARLLRRPRRPVRHPVGEFAGGPRVGADGPGLSGKAVVSLTRIQTHGRGTITIIRTRG